MTDAPIHLRCRRALGVLLLVATSAAAQQNAPGTAQDYGPQHASAKQALAALAEGEATKQQRAELTQRIALLEKGIGYEARAAGLSDARLEERERSVQQPLNLPEREPRPAAWDAPIDGAAPWELRVRQDELTRLRESLTKELAALTAVEGRLTASLRTVTDEAALAAKRGEPVLAREKQEAEARLAAEGTSALEVRVLGSQLRLLAVELAQQKRWRDLIAKEKAKVEADLAALRHDRIAPLRADLARIDQLLLRISGVLLPQVTLPPGVSGAVRGVFERVRDRVRELIDAVADRQQKLATAKDVLDSVELRRKTSLARQRRAVDSTAAEAQSSQAVLYFRLRAARGEIDRDLQALVGDPLWQSLPRHIDRLRGELDAAAADVANVDAHIEADLRKAVGPPWLGVPAELAAPLEAWTTRERSQAEALVAAIEREMLLSLEAVSKLRQHQRSLGRGLRVLERRGLFLRDPSQLTWRNVKRVGELWFGETGSMLASLAGLPVRIWKRAIHPSAGTGVARLQLAIAIVLLSLGLVLTVVFRRRSSHLIAAAKPLQTVPRRLVHQLALAGFVWRAAFAAGVGLTLINSARITALVAEDRRLCSALGVLLLVAASWWSFTKICTRPLLPRLRLLQLDDTKAARLRWLSILGLGFWLLGQLGDVTQALVPDLRGKAAASALGAVGAGGLIAVLLLFFLMTNLQRQIFRSADAGGVRFLQPFVMAFLWPARLALIVALVLWLLSYLALSTVLARVVVAVLGAVVAGVVSHETLREEVRYRFFEEGSARRKAVADYIEVFEFLFSAGVVVVAFSLIQRLDVEFWLGVLAVPLWGRAGEDMVRVGDFAVFVLSLGLTWALSTRVRGTVAFLLEGRERLDRGLRYTLGTLSSYVVVLAGVLFAFDWIHLGFDKLQWLIAALGVGIGFGLQAIISNFFSGLILLFERPLRVGDIVKVGDVVGEVRKITIRATTVTSFDNIDVIVPNKDFITQAITNWTGSDRDMRSTIEVGVAYGTDLSRARTVLLETVEKHGRVYKKPAPAAFVVSFGDSSINFSVRYWTSLDYKLSTFSDLHFAIDAAFKREGIEIPFPQADVRLVSGGSPEEEESAAGPRKGDRLPPT